MFEQLTATGCLPVRASIILCGHRRILDTRGQGPMAPTLFEHQQNRRGKLSDNSSDGELQQVGRLIGRFRQSLG